MASWQAETGRLTPLSRVLSILQAFPIACFTLVLVTDLAFSLTANLMWLNFSAWLLAFGLLGGILAGLWWLAGTALGWWRLHLRWAALGVGVLVVALMNSLVHAGDGWTAVVPWGMALSALTVLLMIVTMLVGIREQR